MCDVKDCDNTGVTLVEPGVLVCDTHDGMKKVICRHCKVEMISRNNHHPILGKQHKKSCPRARMLN